MKVIEILIPIKAIRQGFSIFLSAFEIVLEHKGYKALLWMLAGVLLFWHIYVPVHEMLHVAGCLLGGGEVSALNLKPQYGGLLLSKFFSFVIPASGYAGRLTGFQTPNAWSHALVDFFPYSISLFGICIIRLSEKRNSPFFLGLGFILTFVPLISIPGDYYEAVSLLTTRVASYWNPSLPAEALISDDVFRSVGILWNESMLNISVGILIFIGIIVAAYLAFMTLAVQAWIGNLFCGPFIGRQE